MTTISHLPVMLHEALAGLNIRPDGLYIDATFGRGGHSEAILNRLNAQGRLLCFDKDPQAIAHGQAYFQDNRVIFYQTCFSKMKETLRALGVEKKVDGILLDLGVSSPQLEQPQRGFSFMRDGPLDMRMNPNQGISAAQWINQAEAKTIAKVLKHYGEEAFAKKISHAIVAARLKNPILTTLALANLVAQCVPFKKMHQHPATKTFQAIRIFINQELTAIEQLLQDVTHLLAPGARLAMISFHSLEDRMVKRYFRQYSTVKVPKGLAILEKELIPEFEWVVKRQKPSLEEVSYNHRARSATLRVLQKRV
ncbi:MAG: 16S rRNA (cytosine(1402)-N(4))-methyltransferase RsmH [Proteobacteria bacterium]|nr:16S rRNA (cytosine(1402)-N(4))-methyltransferase RsmH [Pseudomonadota bacterium]